MTLTEVQPDTSEIRAWIKRKMPDLVEDLKRICRIRSVAQLNGPECLPYGAGCRDVLKEMLSLGEENGFLIHNYENYVGRITYQGKTEKNIGIWAHLDVVDEGKDWDYPPYEPTVKDDYFIARGCQDNKSSAIIGLYVLKYLKEHGIKPEHTVELYLGTCEEQGMYDIDYFLEHYQPPALSLVPDSGFPVCLGERGSFNGELCCEEPGSTQVLEITCENELYTVPDKVSVMLEYSAELWEKCCEEGRSGDDFLVCAELLEKDRILITASGISTQASNPEKGKNALSILADFICERGILGKAEQSTFAFIRDINRDHMGTALRVSCEDELSGPVNLVATRLRYTKQHYVIEFISKYPITRNDYPFEKMAEEVAGDRGFSLKVTRFSKANYFDPERQEVKLLTEVSNEVLGREDQPFVMSGGTYARKLPGAFAFGTGMSLPPRPQELFRPGHGDYHQPDESIALERIRKGLEIYIRGILRIDQV